MLLAGSGCGHDGDPPPRGRLYFPIALEQSPDFDADGKSDFLVVANSNFDLRYRSGSLQAYDLNVLEAQLRAHCGPLDADERSTCGINPEEDDDRDDLTEEILVVPGLLRSEVLVGSFADGIDSAASGDGVRFYLPVRSDGDLTYADLGADGALDCGDTPSSAAFDGERHECTDDHREAEDGAAREDGLEVPPDPIAVYAAPRPTGDGNFIVMAHRGGRLSLIWEPTAGARPELVDVIEGYPNEIVDLQADPLTGNLWLPTAFETVVPRAAVALDERSEDSFLFRLSDLAVAEVDFGGSFSDTRAVRFDPRTDVRRAYVLSRRPASLWVVDLEESVGRLRVREALPVGAGASRMEVSSFAAHGDRTLAFVTGFDSRELRVFDVDSAQAVGIVRGIGGPFEVTVDEARDLVYIADFRSSVLRVIDLAPMFECLDGLMDGEGVEDQCSPLSLGTVGRPRAVQELI
ncbi:MAG: hypothetical protein CMN30_32980 [Sandaracinus sp.]|nr:hypothetical protein [Sandaracinus sp.]